MHRSFALALGLLLAASGCGGSNAGLPGAATNDAAAIARGGPALQLVPNRTTSPIRHVIVIVQQHRGFDSLFAGFPGADAPTVGRLHTGQTVALTPMPLERAPRSQPPTFAFPIAYGEGKMDGFDLVYRAQPRYPYHSVARAEIAPYWSLAKRFTLADHMFSTSYSNSSFVAQLYLIAGRARVNGDEFVADHPSREPWGCDAPSGTTTPVYTENGVRPFAGPYPCFAFKTMANLLDAGHVSWKYYTPPGWNIFDSIKYVRDGQDWRRNISSPQTNVLADIAGGKLPQVAWVNPTPADSDNPDSRSAAGPAWVQQVVRAIGTSRYWKSSAVVVVWDTSDFFYDDAAPPQLDADGLGFRVPLIAISPYAKQGYVSHTQYEFGSILKFIEERFALGSLHATDARARSIADCFDFTKSPRPFGAIAKR